MSSRRSNPAFVASALTMPRYAKSWWITEAMIKKVLWQTGLQYVTWPRVLAYYEHDSLQSPWFYIIAYQILHDEQWWILMNGPWWWLFPTMLQGQRVWRMDRVCIKHRNPQLSLATLLDQQSHVRQHVNAISKSMSINHVHRSHHKWPQWECSANMWRRVDGQYVQVLGAAPILSTLQCT